MKRENIHRIAIFRALQLGDLLCCIPALRALRFAFPNAHITLIGLPWSAILARRFPAYIDEVIPFPGYPGLPEQPMQPQAFTRFLEEVQRREFDLVLQMQGNGSVVNPLMELFGARYTAGFCIEGHYRPDNGLFIDYPGTLPEVERHLALMEHLGIPPRGKHLEFPVTPSDEEEAGSLGLNLKAREYVCLHPGSRGAWRQWPPEYFARLGDYFAGQGLSVVITGTEEEKQIAAQVKGHMEQPVVDITGKTSLGAVAALIKNAFALAANCTGVSHIASALSTNSLIISMDGEPFRWAPLDRSLHYVIDWTRNPSFDEVIKGAADLVNRRCL